MKLSVSLSDEDVVALDRFVEQAGLESRSAGIQHAIRRLRDPELEAAYASAWEEWTAEGHAADWEAAAADGVPDEAR